MGKKRKTTCVGCKFLYSEGAGYSNWTWIETYIRCALNRNPCLPSEEPFGWDGTGKDRGDNWAATRGSRCEKFAPGPFIELDVEGEDGPADFTEDEEQIEAVCKHSGRGRHGAIE